MSFDLEKFAEQVAPWLGISVNSLIIACLVVYFVGPVLWRSLEKKQDHKNSAALEKIRQDLDLLKTKSLTDFQEKIALYRQVVDLMVLYISEINATYCDSPPDQRSAQLPLEKVLGFDQNRMKLYAYLGMFAPEDVMRAYESFCRYILDVMHGETPYEWEKIQQHTLPLLNMCRRDIGLNPEPLGKTWEPEIGQSDEQ